MQRLVKKNNENRSKESDFDNDDTDTATKAESEKMKMITKIKQGLNKFVGGYKDFLFLGDVIQMAVAFILGGVFLSLINDFTRGFVTPWLGVIFGQTHFDTLSFTINGSNFPFGKFIDSLLTFIIMTFVLYFALVLPSKWLTEKFEKKHESSQTTCLYCCSSISRKAIKCPHCTSSLEPQQETTTSKDSDINRIDLDDFEEDD